MSIKYLQDQQLNQVQQSPIDSPWAKLVAQSEMLERSRMRQPQGQAPQGTVAGNIQQQLIDAQMKQESEKQNADLYKAQMLSQLIGSGHLPANFAAQGYADGGLTQPGTGVYRGIMVPSQQPARPTSYVPPNSQDPAAQAKKHGMVQSLLDDSIVGVFNGRGNINNTFQDIADAFTGKIFNRGFAEGGSLFGYDPNLNSSNLDPRLLEAQNAENEARLKATEMVRKMHLGDAANRGVLSQLERSPHPMVKRLMEQQAQNEANLKATEMARKMQLGQAANQGAIPETPVPKATSPMAEEMAKAINANKEYIPKTPSPTASMNEAMARNSAENAARMEAAKPAIDDWLREKAGGSSFENATGAAEEGLGAIKKGLGSLGTRASEVLSKAAVPMDIYGASKNLVGNPFPLAYQALTGDKPLSAVASGELPDIVSGVNFNAPSEKVFNPHSPISATSANEYESLANLKPNDMQSVVDRLKGLWGAGAHSNAQPDGWAGAATPATSPVAQTQTPPVAQAQTPSVPPSQGEVYKHNGVIRTKNSVTVPLEKKRDLDAINAAHKQPPPDVPTNEAVAAAQKAAAVAQANQAASKTADEEGQGSILDSLYNKLKDSDVDYSDLAKRISQNEYDLARERKDGTFNAILGGVGAALSKAGSFEGVGDRVFRPGLGAIAGAGILGGLKTSAASDEAIDKKSQENMTAMLALKKLKRESMNDVLDAISAQRQVDATLRSQGITAQHYANTADYQNRSLRQDERRLDLAERTADINAAHTNAQIAELASRNPDQKAAIELAQTKANNAERNLASIRAGAHMPDDPNVQAAQKEYDNAMATLNYLLQSLKVPAAPTGSVAPPSGGSKTTEEWMGEGYFKR